MSTFSELESIIGLTTALDSGQLDSIYDSVATRIAGTAAKDVAEAISELSSQGIDPDKYIPLARSYSRNRREQARHDRDDAMHTQRLQHEQELHELMVAERKLKLREKEAAVQLAEATAAKHVQASA